MNLNSQFLQQLNSGHDQLAPQTPSYSQIAGSQFDTPNDSQNPWPLSFNTDQTPWWEPGPYSSFQSCPWSFSFPTSSSSSLHSSWSNPSFQKWCGHSSQGGWSPVHSKKQWSPPTYCKCVGQAQTAAIEVCPPWCLLTSWNLRRWQGFLDAHWCWATHGGWSGLGSLLWCWWSATASLSKTTTKVSLFSWTSFWCCFFLQLVRSGSSWALSAWMNCREVAGGCLKWFRMSSPSEYCSCWSWKCRLLIPRHWFLCKRASPDWLPGLLPHSVPWISACLCVFLLMSVWEGLIASWMSLNERSSGGGYQRMDSRS